MAKRNIVISALQPEKFDFWNVRDPDFSPGAVDPKRIEKNVATICRLLHEAGRRHSDIAVAPEDIQGISGLQYYTPDPGLFRRFVEPVPGPTTRRLGAIARQHRMCIAAALFERHAGRIYNTAVLLGRKGELIGRYRKTHVPLGEAVAVSPGHAYPVFRTDFGVVGMLICWDMIFPEVARILALRGAELLLFPTLGLGPERIGEAMLSVRAVDNRVYIVMSKPAPPGACPGRSAVIDPEGIFVADAGYAKNVVVTATIDLSVPRGESNPGDMFELRDKWEEVLSTRRPETYAFLAAARPPVEKRYQNIRRLRSRSRLEALVQKKIPFIPHKENA